jgi:DNA-binding LacI/PurR family transcriptional regulator
MGRLAAQTLLSRIEGATDCPAEIPIEPELVLRQSTAPPPLPGSGS